ncbi:PIN domain-containing protein [candidate division KSB1 bacterium]|nr:PIN domain-containing protein [candidate division KSB1 bacterium]
MKIIVDTCIWSLALRRDFDNNSDAVKELEKLILDQKVQMIGPIRQELLSGIRHKKQFNALQSYLSAFPDLIITTQDYELGSEYYNTNREKGIQGSNTDFLICALSHNHEMPIYTEDKDFIKFSEHIPIVLHTP